MGRATVRNALGGGGEAADTAWNPPYAWWLPFSAEGRPRAGDSPAAAARGTRTPGGCLTNNRSRAIVIRAHGVLSDAPGNRF